MKLFRISDAFLPLALLAASALNQPMEAALFCACFLSISLLSLFSCQGLRIAFASQPSLRAARGSVKCALLLQTAALPAALLIAWLTGILNAHALTAWLVAGWLYNIEHTFYEYLGAMGDGYGAALCEAVSALLLLAGICLSGGADASPAWIVGAAALSALIAATASLSPGGFNRGKLNARVIAASPRAALQALLYPALFAATLLLPGRHGAPVAFFSGLMLYALCRTPFRRTPQEAAPMNRGLALALTVCALVYALHKITGWPNTNRNVNIYTGFDLPYTCLAVALAALCAFALYGNFRRRER